MTDPMLPLCGLPSDGGVLVLRGVEERLGVADRLSACLVDLRAPAANDNQQEGTGIQSQVVTGGETETSSRTSAFRQK